MKALYGHSMHSKKDGCSCGDKEDEGDEDGANQEDDDKDEDSNDDDDDYNQKDNGKTNARGNPANCGPQSTHQPSPFSSVTFRATQQ